MNSNRRLANLESKTPGTSNWRNSAPLCELLGLVDGLHYPFRQFGGRVGKLTAVHQQRQAYQRAGIVWQIDGGDSRGWKRSQRTRDAMQADGLISVSRDGELRVCLTIAGDRAARTALGLPTVDSWLPRRLLDLLSELEPDRPGKWIAESSIAGTGDRAGLADCLLPLLSGGIVESLSSTVGEVFYRQTGAPLKTSREDDPQSTNDDPGDRLTKVYSDAFIASLEGRERIEPQDSELIIPLPASRP